VMNFFRRLVDPAPHAVLTQIMSTFHVFVPAILPRFT
jgi:hypothetical protein